MVTFVPDDEDAPFFLRRLCRVLGGALGEPSAPNAVGAMSAVVRGMNAADFRAGIEGTPEFDFSACRAIAGDCRGTEEMRRLE
jgi:hypothetical protein